jgi:hypothetical protein
MKGQFTNPIQPKALRQKPATPRLAQTTKLLTIFKKSEPASPLRGLTTPSLLGCPPADTYGTINLARSTAHAAGKPAPAAAKTPGPRQIRLTRIPADRSSPCSP